MTKLEKQLRSAARLAARDYAEAHDIPSNKCACSRVDQNVLAQIIELRIRDVLHVEGKPERK